MPMKSILLNTMLQYQVEETEFKLHRRVGTWSRTHTVAIVKTSAVPHSFLISDPFVRNVGGSWTAQDSARISSGISGIILLCGDAMLSAKLVRCLAERTVGHRGLAASPRRNSRSPLRAFLPLILTLHYTTRTPLGIPSLIEGDTPLANESNRRPRIHTHGTTLGEGIPIHEGRTFRSRIHSYESRETTALPMEQHGTPRLIIWQTYASLSRVQ